MSARAILSPKVNSLQFEDRVLLLDVPAKIGRSHKDDQVKSAEPIEFLDLSRSVWWSVEDTNQSYILFSG